MNIKNEMLWFDNSDASPMTKIDKAYKAYFRRHRVRPTVCYVHPDSAAIWHDILEVHTSPDVLPNHYLLGVKGD